jgi:ferritin-like metal-binding protein YciE
MTRPKFKTEIKLFSLTERSQGKGWQKIRQHIGDKFNVEPPTVRAMQKWQKTINPETIYDELLRETKQQIPRIGAEVQIQVAQNLLPVLSKAREAGEDMETAAWRWFFQWAESYLGKDRFIHLVTDYLSEQKKISDRSIEEMKK